MVNNQPALKFSINKINLPSSISKKMTNQTFLKKKVPQKQNSCIQMATGKEEAI